MIAHGMPIYVALEPVDMRLGAERLGAMVREKMQAEPRSRHDRRTCSHGGHASGSSCCRRPCGGPARRSSPMYRGVPAAEMSEWRIVRDAFHGDWNYVIHPR